ncbi:hypothetical protein [Dactylosporangium sp. CA-233914]|uniref:hypothetical protein n=1 Tax=Dactylosporangium sp. CA-233914 TaxID=3239934 RepID=UPI003D920432
MTDTVTIPLATLLAAARGLAGAARWEQATGLLDAASPGDPRIALAAADIAVEAGWFTGIEDGPARLSEVDEHGLDAEGRWDLEFTWLRYEYRAAMRRRKDSAVRQRAERLAATAPDATRLGWAHMYLGLICDNVFSERADAPPHYAIALANSDADPLLRREAQRHLGDHAHDRGDHEDALARWRDATEAGARAGLVAGTLSQQMLLAVLARDAGDEAGAVALAAEIERWALAIGATRTAAQATAFRRGVDPTQPPPQE